jgi:hypothetical protein
MLVLTLTSMIFSPIGEGVRLKENKEGENEGFP